jgi:ectoine hydroxylase-related dioxygenase (phytanoyl-CoA dioxygenase family)
MTRRLLTDDEVGKYNRDGYLVVEDFFPPAVLDDINGELNAYLVSPDYPRKSKSLNCYIPSKSKSPTTNWILSLAKSTDKIAAFCKQDAVLDLISPIVYPGIAIYSAKMVNKEPHDPTECLWHQDEAYYNGCLRVIPGSHLEGLRPASRKAEGHCDLAVDTPIDESRIRLVPMKGGSILLFDALLLHSSGGNQSDRPRRAFIVSYQEASCLAGNREQWELLRPDDYMATKRAAIPQLVS